MACEFKLNRKAQYRFDASIRVQPGQLIQEDINRYPTHDSNSTWSEGLFTKTASADVV